MKVLVINAGSSSLKYQLIDMENEQLIAKGICERVKDTAKSCISYTHYTANGKVAAKDVPVPMENHTAAFHEVKNVLTTGETKVIDDISEITAVGHRVVQGGALFNKSVLIDQSVIDGIESLCDLAPLHNPAHLEGIRASIALFGPDVPQVAVFDNAFHSTMPPEAYMYGLPYEYYEKYGIRKYGFHGTSHRFVSARCAEVMGRPIEELKIVTCHLGNGSSITAVKNGKVIDTSMGLTPLDGEIMGTRTGAIDASAVLYVMKKENKSVTEMEELLNKKSGILGVSGLSSDDRDVKKAAAEGNERAKLARGIQIYEIKKFIGAYTAAMDGIDAIVFTGGIGENAEDMRATVCDGLSYLGIEIDKPYNSTLVKGAEGEISTKNSKVRVFVLPTNEELLIARDTRDIVNSL
ncbi:MAG TPA: acetate kinase [Candidatus Fimenecus stercoravium]|nr:acetate kinase [Candidatus Fimenecus stercoravium]